MSTDQELSALVRGLAHPDKPVRDETIENVSRFANRMRNVAELDMMKLWKALYYCLWLTDKDHIQREVSMLFAQLIMEFKTLEIRVLYLSCFFKTILREWTLLDQYRTHKMYVLLRIMLKAIFTYIVDSNYSMDVMEPLISCLEASVLSKTPNGVRFHFADMYLEELSVASSGRISSKHFVVMVQPFLNAIVSGNDASYVDRVSKRVFQKYLSSFAPECTVSSDGDRAAGVFRKVNTKLLQALVFEMASSDSRNMTDGARKRLYAIHKEFQKVTRVDHVDVATALSAKIPKAKSASKKVKEKEKEKEKESTTSAPAPENKKSKTPVEEASASKESKKRRLPEESAAAPTVSEEAPKATPKKQKSERPEAAPAKANPAEKAPKSVPAAASKEKEKPSAKAAVSEADKNKALLQAVSGAKAPAAGGGATRVVNGVTIQVVKEGPAGAAAAVNGKRIKMHYTGKLKNGKVFDSSVGRKPFAFRLGAGEVIRGWDIGIQGMKVGERRVLTIPPEKGYGRQGSPPVIPGNATLIFEVACLDVAR